ncbi:MAG TPA: cytochrome c [Candidatus Acidoferrum sp.]|nr:cytochrome c [Candidatus Acidoferrum sp.]
MPKGLVRYALILLAVGALPAPGVRADASAQKTYQAKCAGCHGADGKGQTGAGKALGAHDFSAPEIQKMSDAELAQIITNGKGKMPPYGRSLSAAEIKDLVSYIRGFAKK